jgi:ketosteroid isomerase-like protein
MSVRGQGIMKQVFVCAAAVSLASCQTATPVMTITPQRSCSSAASVEAVSAAIRAFFAALASDDEAALRRVTTPTFYAFDVGERFTGPELSKLIGDAHKAGRILQWNVGPVDARVDCNTAFAAWENKGAAGTAGNLKPRAWLESALLVRSGDGWLIDFLHSTPKNPAK